MSNLIKLEGQERHWKKRGIRESDENSGSVTTNEAALEEGVGIRNHRREIFNELSDIFVSGYEHDVAVHALTIFKSDRMGLKTKDKKKRRRCPTDNENFVDSFKGSLNRIVKKFGTYFRRALADVLVDALFKSNEEEETLELCDILKSVCKEDGALAANERYSRIQNSSQDHAQKILKLFGSSTIPGISQLQNFDQPESDIVHNHERYAKVSDGNTTDANSSWRLCSKWTIKPIGFVYGDHFSHLNQSPSVTNFQFHVPSETTNHLVGSMNSGSSDLDSASDEMIESGDDTKFVFRLI